MDPLPAEDAEFWAAVRALPPRQARAVALYYLEDLSVQQTATVLGCAEGTVKAHLAKARRTLARRLRHGRGRSDEPRCSRPARPPRRLLGSVTRVDPVAGLEELLRRRRRGRITRAAAALATATAVAVVAWVGVRGAERVAPVVNPPPASLGRVTATIPVGAGPVRRRWSAGSGLGGQRRPGHVSRIDPATNTVTDEHPVGRNPVRLAAGFGSIWVANKTSQTCLRIDARTGQPQATIPVTDPARQTSWPSAPARSGSSPATRLLAPRPGHQQDDRP